MNKKLLLQTLTVVILLATAGLTTYFALNKAGEKSDMPAYDPGQLDITRPGKVLLNVPFTAQAPTGNWSDPRQEDGCEEASLLMAWLWVHNQGINGQDAEKAIIAMSDFEQSHYGNYSDFDAEDTAKLMKDYYDYDKVSVQINPSLENIKQELLQDNLVLVPTNGQVLNNPHYKQPGPLTHMLLLKGFDDSTEEFITNDPGTKFGESYSFSYQTVYAAMVDYPSGNHESQAGRPKAMLVISK